MFDKLKQLHAMKQQADEIKSRLDRVTVKGESHGVEVFCTANRKITEVRIPPAMMGSVDANTWVMEATNRALESAERVFESEMRTLAGGLMNMPGLS